MRTPYRAYPADPTPASPSDTSYRPTVLVRVIGRSGTLNLWGIADTGAEECLLPDSVREAIAPAVRPGASGLVVTAGGRPLRVTYGTVDLEIPGAKRTLRWRATVAFTEGRDEEALWGYAGFLEHFSATFNGRERHLTLRARGPLPEPIMPHGR